MKKRKNRLNIWYIKTFYISILLIFIAHSSNGQNKDLLNLFKHNQTCKSVTTKKFTEGSGLCSSTIMLNNDSTFVWERGCEGSSRITLGIWKIIGDSIELIATKKKDLDLVCDIEFSKNMAKNSTTFFIKDINGDTVKNFNILPINKSSKYIDSVKTTQFILSYMQKKITVNFFENDTLELSSLKNVTGESFKFNTKSLSDTITIILKTNNNIFYYQDVTYVEINKPIRYKLFNDKIINEHDTLTIDK